MSGAKIVEALKEAVAGNFSRVTIQGKTWVQLDRVSTLDACIREIVRDELIRCNLLKDASDDI